MKKIIIYLSVFVCLLICLFLASFRKHETNSVEDIEFFVEKPFIAVVKELANKDSLEKIIEQDDGVVSEKHWEKFDISVPQKILRLKEYKLNGILKFKVFKKDKDLGDLDLSFEQEMNLDKNELLIQTKLLKPQESVNSYLKTIKIVPSDFGTMVRVRNEIKIIKTIPFFFDKIMDKRVSESNKKDLERLKENILIESGPVIRVFR